MSGIYIHIPFCKQACHYCNFHFSTTFEKYRQQMIDAICREIFLRKDFFSTSKTSIQSVYFGGGTPSILTPGEFNQIWHTLQTHFDLNRVREVTLEANPDDMDDAFFQFLAETEIDRLSIGVQSFDNLDLAYLNRVHDAGHALESIQKAIRSGIEKISTDLIFGIPTSGIARLDKDVRTLADIGVTHISAYALTVEPQTALYSLIKKKKVRPVNEAKSAEEMSWMMTALPALGFEQYETSNYAVPGFEAIHNSSYWHDVPYLGIGPSAHSYNKPVRSWNISNNMSYIQSLDKDILPQESELLTAHERYEEWVMTKLRLREGINGRLLESEFGAKVYENFLTAINPFIKNHSVEKIQDSFVLTRSGKLITDYITRELFL